MNNNGTITLETDRLILRKFKMEDAEGMYNNWATDPETCKFLSWNVHKNLEETKNVIANWIEKYNKDSYNWIVELKESHEVIGSICDNGFNRRHQVIDIGYCYGSKYWGNGYATEALRKVIEYLLINEKFYIVTANHRSSNPASGKVMEKAGMKKEAILRDRKYDILTNERFDMIYYSIEEKEL